MKRFQTNYTNSGFKLKSQFHVGVAILQYIATLDEQPLTCRESQGKLSCRLKIHII